MGQLYLFIWRRSSLIWDTYKIPVKKKIMVFALNLVIISFEDYQIKDMSRSRSFGGKKKGQ